MNLLRVLIIMKNNLIKKAITILYFQYKSIVNLILRILKNDPILIATIILVPGFFYIIMELTISSEVSIYALNPNLYELFNSYNILFHRILYYMLVIIPPIYILMTQLNIKSYYKMITMNVEYKSITIVNLILLLVFMDLIFFIILLAILLKTQSTMISIIFCVFLLILTINVIITIFYLFNILIVNKIIKKTMLNVLTTEFIILLMNTIILLLLVTYVPYDIIFQISPTLIIVIQLLIVFFVLRYFMKAKINSKYVIRSSKNKSKVIKTRRTITLILNYMLMIYNNKKSFIEYILSILLLFIALRVAALSNEMNTLIYQLVIPMLLIPNGLICSYVNWFQLHDKKVFNKLRILDSIIMSFLSIILYFIITLVVSDEISYISFFIFTFTFFICLMIQWNLKFKFCEQNYSYFTFIIIYGIFAYLIYSILYLGVTYV